MGAGRPTDYKKEYCDLLIEHGKQGLSFESFAGVIGQCRSTLYVWTKEHKEFMDAKKLSESYCRLFWEKIGVDYIINRNDPKGMTENLNNTVWIFNMKNRFGWRDKVETVESDSFDDVDFVDE